MKNLAIGTARALFLTVFVDCALLIFLNIRDGLKYVDLFSLVIEVLLAAMSLFIVIKLFTDKGDSPLLISDKIIRTIMVIVLIAVSFSLLVLFGSGHDLVLTTSLTYIFLFILTFLAVAYTLRVK
ncbi:MAG: hypothetical protein V4577_24915 [Bacteroidota bacterium]